MADLTKARAAIESILKLPTISKDVRYYAEVALSHLQPEKEHGTERTTTSGPPGQDDGQQDRDTYDRKY